MTERHALDATHRCTDCADDVTPAYHDSRGGVGHLSCPNCGGEDLEPLPTEMYRYRHQPLGASSAKYGPCEICHRHVSDVCLQTEERFVLGEDGTGFWTKHDCTDWFGHADCLARQRKEPCQVGGAS